MLTKDRTKRINDKKRINRTKDSKNSSSSSSCCSVCGGRVIVVVVIVVVAVVVVVVVVVVSGSSLSYFEITKSKTYHQHKVTFSPKTEPCSSIK